MTLTTHLRPAEHAPYRREADSCEQWLQKSIFGIAAYEFGLERNALLSKRRHPELVRGRAFIVWALRSLGRPLSYPAIGKLLGDRDHSGIMNLHEKAIRLRLEDAAFKDACDRCAVRFQAMGETVQ